MKKTVIAAASLVALVSTSALAQGYVSAAAGVSRVDLDCAGTTRCDTSGNAVKLTGGYAFSGPLALELGYINFGKASGADNTVSADAKASGVTLGLAYAFDLTPSWSTTLRGGAARLKTKISGTVRGVGSGTASETNTAPYVGFGLGYEFNKTVKMETGLDFSRAEFDGDKGDVRAFTIGVRIGF